MMTFLLKGVIFFRFPAVSFSGEVLDLASRENPSHIPDPSRHFWGKMMILPFPKVGYVIVFVEVTHPAGQIIATSHDLGPQMVVQ